MKYPRIFFSLLVPLAELLIWVLLVPIPTTLVYLGLHSSRTHPGDTVISTKIGSFTLSEHMVWQIALEGPAIRASHTITSLNIPGIIVEALIPWHPAELSMDAWRSFTLPFFCLPAWWFIGRGFDLLKSRQMRWLPALIGTAFFITLIVLFWGLRFEIPPDERVGGSWILWGIAFWILLFGIFPLAWLFRRPEKPDEVNPARACPPAC